MEWTERSALEVLRLEQGTRDWAADVKMVGRATRWVGKNKIIPISLLSEDSVKKRRKREREAISV